MDTEMNINDPRGYAADAMPAHADALEEIQRLREALKPFAEHADMYPAEEVQDSAAIWWLPVFEKVGKWATIGDCRKAKEVLGG
jgi:hypothetical protein